MKKVIITDYSDYKAETSNNGGNYSYSTIYRLVENGKYNGKYEVSYSTSAEFDFCPCCGRFGCTDCDPSSDEDYEYISESKVKTAIKEANKHGFVVETL